MTDLKSSQERTLGNPSSGTVMRTRSFKSCNFSRKISYSCYFILNYLKIFNVKVMRKLISATDNLHVFHDKKRESQRIFNQ